MKRNQSYKFIAAMALVALCFISVPVRSFAMWGEGDTTFDPATFGENVAEDVEQVENVVDQTKQLLKSFGLDGLAYTLSQKASQKIVASILNQVNGGASGNQSPNFITNFTKYFSDISNSQVSGYTGILNNSSNPFAKSISAGISNNTAATNSGTTALNSFSLNTVLGNTTTWQTASTNIGSAGNKGWDFYSALGLPQNTQLGSAMIAQDELAQRIVSSQNTAKTELTSSGYTPQKKPNTGTGSSSGAETYSDINNNNIQSPSSTNQQNVNSANGEAQQRLQGSDQFYKIVFNTLTSLISNVVKNGIASARSDAAQAPQYQYGSLAQTNNIINGVNGQPGNWEAVPQQIIDFQEDLDIENQKTSSDVQYNEDLLNAIKQPVSGVVYNSADVSADETWMDNHGQTYDDSQPMYDQFNAFNQAHPTAPLPNPGEKDALVNLETCLPGPDTGWEARLSQYVDSQLSNLSKDSTDSNSADEKVQTLISSMAETAIQEEEDQISNPFLNIPSAQAMQQILSSYYQNTQQFQSTFNTLLTKKQTSSTLSNIVAEVKAMGNAFNPPLVLFDDQWQALSPSAQAALYASLYNNPNGLQQNSANYEDANANLTPPAPGDPSLTSSVMESWVLDQDWYTWETDTTTITEDQRQNLYRQFVAVEQNVSDATTLQTTENTLLAVEEQTVAVADSLHDCNAIVAAVKAHAGPNAPSGQWSDADWTNFKNTDLYSNQVKTAFTPDVSIIAVANGTTGENFSSEGDITLPIQNIADVPGNQTSTQFVALHLEAGVTENTNDLLSGHHPSPGQLPNFSAPITPNPELYSSNINENNINYLQVQPVVPQTPADSSLDPQQQVSPGTYLGPLGHAIPTPPGFPAVYDPTADGSLPPGISYQPGSTITVNIGVPSSDVIKDFFQEDTDNTLFCRLPNYALVYGVPIGYGSPISCSTIQAYVNPLFANADPAGQGADWYKTTKAQIYYNFSAGGNSTN